MEGRCEMKYYVIADIHGYYSKTVEALRAAGYYDDPAPHKLIICGDLFDRGSEPLEMQEFVLDLLSRDEVILIRGNHEDLMEDLVEDLPYIMNSGLPYTHHYRNGTVKTLLRLIDAPLVDALARPKYYANKMKQGKFFQEILPLMQDYFETEHYVFVHGWIPADALPGPNPSMYFPIEDWRHAGEAQWKAARWHNGMQAAKCGVLVPNKTVVCGHFHTSYGHARIEGKGSEWGEDADFSPYRAEGILCLDGCTAASGIVNCAVLED